VGCIGGVVPRSWGSNMSIPAPRTPGRSAYEQTRRFEEHSLLLVLWQVQHEVRKLIAGPTVFICDEWRRTLHGYHP